jgi:hypothetical protein
VDKRDGDVGDSLVSAMDVVEEGVVAVDEYKENTVHDLISFLSLL